MHKLMAFWMEINVPEVNGFEDFKRLTRANVPSSQVSSGFKLLNWSLEMDLIEVHQKSQLEKAYWVIFLASKG